MLLVRLLYFDPCRLVRLLKKSLGGPASRSRPPDGTVRTSGFRLGKVPSGGRDLLSQQTPCAPVRQFDRLEYSNATSLSVPQPAASGGRLGNGGDMVLVVAL
jgi:hypothetical protein